MDIVGTCTTALVSPSPMRFKTLMPIISNRLLAMSRAAGSTSDAFPHTAQIEPNECIAVPTDIGTSILTAWSIRLVSCERTPCLYKSGATPPVGNWLRRSETTPASDSMPTPSCILASSFSSSSLVNTAGRNETGMESVVPFIVSTADPSESVTVKRTLSDVHDTLSSGGGQVAGADPGGNTTTRAVRDVNTAMYLQMPSGPV
mmetsp:Transcript_6754/g.10704  ORF Transcript_6754/g.10704 Transcript_6754/m.10704 type:complete len:203 (-) Transcript_6754:2068-2676(-)